MSLVVAQGFGSGSSKAFVVTEGFYTSVVNANATILTEGFGVGSTAAKVVLEGFGAPATSAVSSGVGGGGSKPWKQKWRQELVELLAVEAPIEVPAKVGKAIQKVLAKAPPDDSSAIRSLRNELSRLNVSYKPTYIDALRQRAFEAFEAERLADAERLALEIDDEEVIMLLH